VSSDDVFVLITAKFAATLVRDFFKDDILIIKSFCGVEGISSKENGVSSWRSKTGR
jgi:hypothetical protein